MSTIYAPAHPNNYGGYVRQNTPKALVFHTPEEMPDAYEATPEWFQNPAAGASTQAYADNDGDLYKMLEDEDCAWACGTKDAVNRHWYGASNQRPPWGEPGVSNNCLTLNIEVEGRAHDLAMPEAQYQTVLRWAHEKCVKWGIPIDRDHLVGHGDLSSDRKDPGPHFPWDRLLTDLKALVDCGAVAPVVPVAIGIVFRALDPAQSLDALERSARSLGAATNDDGVTVVEVAGGLPPDVAKYVPPGGHAYIFTTRA